MLLGVRNLSSQWILRLLMMPSTHLDLIIKSSSKETNGISVGIAVIAFNDAPPSCGESSSDIFLASQEIQLFYSPWFKIHEGRVVGWIL